MGYAVARTTMDESTLRTRESFMFEMEMRGTTGDFANASH
jgi:hypothetical protein